MLEVFGNPCLLSLHDVNVLNSAGQLVAWLRQLPLLSSVEVTHGDASTRLEWVVDSDDRFSPTMRDATFGYVLHPVDLAINKVMAAAGGHEVRDLVDLVMIHDTILPLGVVIWVAVDKSPGFTPEGLVVAIRRTAYYPAAEQRAVLTEEPLDPHTISARFRAALDEAEAFVARMPTDKMGLLFLQDGKVVQPAPGHLKAYATHAEQRRGHWPTSPDIAAAMFEYYKKPPSPS